MESSGLANPAAKLDTFEAASSATIRAFDSVCARGEDGSGGSGFSTAVLHGGFHHQVHRYWQSSQASTTLTKASFIYPIFISDDADAIQPITSLPGQSRWGLNRLNELLDPLVAKGLKTVILFGVPVIAAKDPVGTLADAHEGPVIQAVHLIKKLYPSLQIACDVCLCEYTSHGHCGILNDDGTINNTLSVRRLADVSLAYAQAGAHIIAPSDMMDGRIGAIKDILHSHNMSHRVALMAYSAKFASAFYGPFREAAGSAPSQGNRKCYQLPAGARGLARRAIRRDVGEGADVIMVKPGTPYLDVIRDAKEICPDLPIAVYQVSGEFAMMHAAAKQGVFELNSAILETMEGFTRAGAGIILTYFTPELLDMYPDARLD
ncbi:putative porphobilinogen synthase [Ramicandelaber brevisporus]|nr:putative porphobilinogen synthase [Ramicandelaber brevisporus]